jgi:RNA polymerase sigma-70 factor (ECF subfamily)
MAEEERRHVDAAVRGDVESFNMLVRAHESRVYGVCVRLVGDRDDAADVAQDTFISAFSRLSTYRGGSFRAWLLRIATNAALDFLRARRRRPTISIDAHDDDPDDHPVLQVADAAPTPEMALDQRELAQAIQRALAQLPDDQRTAIVLRDVEGFDYAEVAEITHTSLGTVKSRISRGRARLRDILTADGTVRTALSSE